MGSLKSDGTWNYYWKRGRELGSMVSDNTTWTYSYNGDGIRIGRTDGTNTYTYIYNGDKLTRVQYNGNLVRYNYDESGNPISLRYNNVLYFVDTNLQGDVVGIRETENNDRVVNYVYDAYGKICSITGSLKDTLGVHNVLRYRGYVYDQETGLYYLQSRYYNPEWGRFISADAQLAGASGSLHGTNLFAYANNNPINMADPDGNWPKWLSGALNIVGGALQVAAGAALGATVGWTGFGAVAAGFLIVNGAATATQGVGQIINHVANSNVMREDNIIRTGVQDVGQAIGGDTGAKIAGSAYDIAVVAANLYSGKVGLQQTGTLPIKVNIDNVVNNPLDDFVTIGPADGVIQQYCRTIPQSGYGKIYATQLGNGLYQIANGHHRVAALRALGYKTINIFLTK